MHRIYSSKNELTKLKMYEKQKSLRPNVKGESMLPRYHLDLRAAAPRASQQSGIGDQTAGSAPAARKWLLSAPDKDLHRMSSLYGTADGKLVSS